MYLYYNILTSLSQYTYIFIKANWHLYQSKLSSLSQHIYIFITAYLHLYRSKLSSLSQRTYICITQVIWGHQYPSKCHYEQENQCPYNTSSSYHLLGGTKTVPVVAQRKLYLTKGFLNNVCQIFLGGSDIFSQCIHPFVSVQIGCKSASFTTFLQLIYSKYLRYTSIMSHLTTYMYM